MLLDLELEINYGDLVVDSDARYYLVVKNTFSEDYKVSLINIAQDRVEDEVPTLLDIPQVIDIIGVIPRDELLLSRRYKEC